ncbi:hypothetical protein [Streptomyces sp. NPDC058092]|uniref:hypothetical protein n=1 Tax=Streptomyces sp. NPDC058092 TaxID=3346336 RepID=UPI0036EAD4CB
MTTMTIALADTDGQDPAYYAGRADAYDDHRAGTDLDTLIVRLGYLMNAHPDLAYVTGYADRVLEIRAETAAVTAAETELAHTLGGAL